jgi:enterochelin esterase-like enzyme
LFSMIHPKKAFRIPLVLIILLICGGCSPGSNPAQESPAGILETTQIIHKSQTITLNPTFSGGSLAEQTPTPSLATSITPLSEPSSTQAQIDSTPVPSTGIITPASATPESVGSQTLTESSSVTIVPGTIESGEVETPLLDQALQYQIYLPPGYDTQRYKRYPVLYLLHGVGYTDDQWLRLGIATTADRLISQAEISPLIIVMPNEEGSSLPDQTSFGEAVATDLVDWIDSNYRTLTNRSDRAIGGLSRGASWSVRLGLIYWQTFGSIGAHSYPMFYGDNSQIPDWLEAIPSDSYPRIYLDIGAKDPGLQVVLKFEDYLTQQNIPHEFHLNIGYHEEGYWKAHVEEYLLWYAADW